MSSDTDRLAEQLGIALSMLAEWCVAVDVNGTGWDEWDEYFKDAMYRPGPLRELLDAAIAEARQQRIPAEQEWRAKPGQELPDRRKEAP